MQKNVINGMKSSYDLSSPSHSDDAKLPSMDMYRTLPRQMSTGYQRGTQTIAGEIVVSDLTTASPVITISGISQNQIFSDPVTKINQIVIGSFGNNSYGMKVAKPGYDVLRANDDQLIFNSSQNVFKVAKILHITEEVLATSPGPYALSYAHNLNYPPAYFAFALYSDAPSRILFVNSSSGLSSVKSYVSYVDSELINIAYIPDLTDYTSDITVYLMQEAANAEEGVSV